MADWAWCTSTRIRTRGMNTSARSTSTGRRFVDPAFAPGTGTPEVGGLTSYEALVLVRALAGQALVGADVVEVSPPYDGPGQITALLGANLLFELVSVLALQK